MTDNRTEPRTAVYCATRSRYRQMIASAKSLLYHNGADRIVFLTEDDNLLDAEQIPNCVSIRNVSGQTLFPQNGPNYTSRYSWIVMLRTAYTKLFPDLHRVLSIDTDTIALRDAGSIWDYDMTGRYFSSVREVYQGIHDIQPHYRIGVAILNLDMLRDGTDEKIIRMVNTIPLECPEQNAYCAICAGHILELPPEYNATWYGQNTVPESKAIIYHYSNYGPIESHSAYRKYARMTWDTALRHRTGG